MAEYIDIDAPVVVTDTRGRERETTVRHILEMNKGVYTAADVRPVKWIPVTERLPENDQDVLVMVHWRDYPENMMCYGRKYKTRWYLWNGELGELIKGFDITHWMPLPEPPKEE